MEHDEVREQDEVGADVVADSDLVTRTRSGDSGAFGELWRRHYRAGVTVARNMTSSLDADDLVQEAYTRIYHSIVSGGGPTGSFRAYLFTSIRNTAAAWGRARRETAYDELDGVEDPSAGEHESEAALDRGLTHQAFRSLPTRWQEVLWYSEIEQMKPAEIAPLLGMKPTAVAQLTFRAREGLREAWIQAHLRSVADGSECQWTIGRLGAYARRNLGRRDHAKVERHLATCVRCSIVASEAKEVSSRLALVLLPLAVGAAGTAGYLATVQGGGTTLVAMAEMPSAVVEGATTVLPRAADFAVGAGSSTGAGSGAAATGGTIAGSTSAAAGTGTGVGAGAAAVSSSAGAVGSAVAAGTTTAVVASAAGGSTLAGLGAASGLAAASLVVVGGVVAAAASLPPAAPEPSPTPVVVAAELPAAVLPFLAEETDPALQLSDEAGPDPADIPVIADGAESLDPERGKSDSAGPHVDGADPGGGHGAPAGSANAEPEDDEDAAPHASAPDVTRGNGSGRDDDAPTDGTPTRGAGRGDSGDVAQEGTTGGGTRPNGTAAGHTDKPAADDKPNGRSDGVTADEKPNIKSNGSTAPGKARPAGSPMVIDGELTASPAQAGTPAAQRPTGNGAASPADQRGAGSAADAPGRTGEASERAAGSRAPADPERARGSRGQAGPERAESGASPAQAGTSADKSTGQALRERPEVAAANASAVSQRTPAAAATPAAQTPAVQGEPAPAAVTPLAAPAAPTPPATPTPPAPAAPTPPAQPAGPAQPATPAAPAAPSRDAAPAAHPAPAAAGSAAAPAAAAPTAAQNAASPAVSAALAAPDAPGARG